MSSGKVKCTCGWSWNKSDSSKKDMYICHECGRDNSNNMKNGGWLDNIPQAQEGIKSPNVWAQEQHFQEKKKEDEEYEKLIGDAGEEAIDIVQRFTPLKYLPGLGSTFAVGEAEANNQDAALSDELGMIPNPYAQAASLMLLYAEKEGENIRKFNENKYRGKDLSELAPEEDVNNRVIDKTYVPKPKVIELKETKKETKSKKVPYTEKKETNKVEIDNTRTVKPRVNNNYKPESKPETKYKFDIPSITYSDKSFVMPREVNDTKIDNTYVAKPRRKNGGWLDSYADGGTMQEHQENYNDYKVSAPEDFKGNGYSNVGRNYSPAWGGQFKEGGEVDPPRKKVIAESTGVYKKPFNEKELKNIIKDDVEYRRTGDVKKPRAEANKFEKFLPNKKTANFFKKLKKEAGPAIFKEALKIQHERGNPAINVGTDKGLPFAHKRNYNPFTNEVNIPADSPVAYENHIYDYLKEVSHAGQPLSEVVPRFLTNDVPGYIKAYTSEGDIGDNIEQYVYDNPNTVENYTHSKIQPELEQRINSSYSWPMSKAEELEDLNLTLKYGLDKKQMGGSVYPVNYVPQAQNGEFKIDFSKGPAGEMKEDINKSKKKKETPIQKEQNVTVKESTKVNKNIPTKIEQKKQWAPEDVSKLNIPEQVTRQIDYTKYWDDPKQNFAVVDKDSNVMYYVNPLGQIIGHENIVTGATNKDEENAPSMLEYGKTANEYYDYLKNTNQRVTPEGVFTLRSNKNNSVGKPHSLWDRAIGALPFTDDVRLNTLDDPSLLHAVYNEMPWREEEKKEYYDHRKESYGPTGNMLRMISQYGVPSSKGLHGTGNVNRIKALDTPGADRNLSNGCINVGGRTKCFDILGDKAKLYVMPEAKDESGFKNVTSSKNQLYSKFGHYDDSDKKNWVEDEDLKISREEIKAAKETKNKIVNIIKKNKINATPEEIDFVAAVAQKETKGGESWLSKAESVLPGFSSYGLYEQKESFPYLKGKSPNDEVASTQAVIDFYRDMHKKHPDLEFDFYPNEQIYSTYNSGKEDWDESGIYHGKDFRKVLQAVKGYENGGSLPGAPGHMYARVGAPSKGPRRNQTDVTDASAQNGKEMSYYQNGLDWKPKTISREGSIIKDDMGYWNPENWDSPVEIGSNNITMQDVPFDVLGISDEGDVQHMKANSPKNYKYKGKKVTEFRMAKNGMRQEQKGLVNLDQLTNFTNYNTKQPGGWLDTL